MKIQKGRREFLFKSLSGEDEFHTLVGFFWLMNVGLWPIVLKNSVFAVDEKILGPLLN